MIIFDQLRISDDGKRMYINAHVNNADYFENIFIESVTIMTADKVLETAPGTPTEDYIFKETYEDNRKEVALVLTAHDFTKSWETDPYSIPFKDREMSSTLFFVYIKCKEGPLVGCPPCTLDELTTLGVVFDETLLYQRVMDYTRELADDCKVSQGFADFILLWNAFKASVETEHFIPAIKYFNMLFGNYGGKTGYVGRKGCGCHG